MMTKYIYRLLIVFFIILINACSSDSSISLEQLRKTNGIYTYNNKPYIGKASSHFSYSGIPQTTIDCFLNEENIQVCTIEEFSHNGIYRYYGSTHNGNKQGLWYRYKYNTLIEKHEYSNNQKEGISSLYKDNELYEEKEYMEDMLHGRYTSYYTTQEDVPHEHNAQTNATAHKSISLSIKEQGEYLYDMKEGIWKSYYQDGNLATQTQYSHGKRNGIYVSYYNNGVVQEKGTYSDDVQHGIWHTFYDNGQLQCERTYINGLQEGLEINYHKNARLQDKIPYHNGLVKGVIHSYDDKGDLERTTFYDIMKE